MRLHSLGRSLKEFIDPTLSFGAQLRSVAWNASSQLQLQQLLHHLDWLPLPIPFYFISAILISLLGITATHCTREYLWRWIRRQNRGPEPTDSFKGIFSVLDQQHWLPVSSWALFKMLMLAIKAHNSKRQVYLTEHLFPNISVRLLTQSAIFSGYSGEMGAHQRKSLFSTP